MRCVARRIWRRVAVGRCWGCGVAAWVDAAAGRNEDDDVVEEADDERVALEADVDDAGLIDWEEAIVC